MLTDNSLLQSFFENSTAAILVVGKNTTILLINRETEKLTGYSKQELQEKRKWIDLVPVGDRDKVRNHLRGLKANEKGSSEKLECNFVDRHGLLKTVSLSGYYHPESGLTILNLINITEQKENVSLLENARAKAEASDKLKTAFLGNLSHEIRTPMNAIMGFASLLQMEGLTEEKRGLYLTQIVNGSSDLLQLVDKTIVISRIDLGQLKINSRQFFINKRLKELQNKYKKALLHSGKEDIELSLELGRKDDDFVIQADQMRVMDVLNNLLENAVKFTGCGKITLGYTYLDEDIDNTSDSLLFYVKDTGPGISKENTEIVFDRFVKLVDKNETVLKGAGLGLAISHDIVKLMGGDIWLESVEGEGCKFFFTLPLNFSKKQRSGFPKLSSDPVDINWSSCSILIAEDMESNYIYLKELLLPTEIKILRARDVLEAVEIFESNPDIDVVLMDILMPMLDGYEATKRIREIREDVPVVAQTAFSFEGEMQNGLYAGCFSDYIMKPFTRDLLIANIKKYLRAK